MSALINAGSGASAVNAASFKPLEDLLGLLQIIGQQFSFKDKFLGFGVDTPYGFAHTGQGLGVTGGRQEQD